jgi:hypothetical protein
LQQINQNLNKMTIMDKTVFYFWEIRTNNRILNVPNIFRKL